jgi:hypothetical protein
MNAFYINQQRLNDCIPFLVTIGFDTSFGVPEICSIDASLTSKLKHHGGWWIVSAGEDLSNCHEINHNTVQYML